MAVSVPEKRFIFVLLIIVATLAGCMATSRTLSEVTMAAKHERWMARHGRAYAREEEKEARFKIFRDNVRFINNFNRAANATFKLGINQFADLTDEEFQALTLTKNPFSPSHSESLQATSSSFLYENVSLAEVEPSMDWRTKGAVTSVKNQSPCGSCWIFSGVAAIEGIVQIKTGKLVSLSEQEVMDCIAPGQYTCMTGGYPPQVFDYVIQNGGLVPNNVYPYGAQYESCQSTNSMGSHKYTISTYQNVPKYNEDALLKAVNNQPVSVLVDASNIKFYQSGIINGYCGTSLNHAVTAVGYGTTDNGYKYWIVKNSWGETWGEDGYFFVQRDSGSPEGMCGIAMNPSYPVINN